jgi:hypothetical protein
MSKTPKINPNDLAKVKGRFQKLLFAFGGARVVDVFDMLVFVEGVYARTRDKKPEELSAGDIEDIRLARRTLLDAGLLMER